VLLDLSKLELNKFMPEVLAEGIIRMRQNRVKIISGFDGQYGQVEIFSEQERKQSKDNEQTSMFIE